MGGSKGSCPLSQWVGQSLTPEQILDEAQLLTTWIMQGCTMSAMEPKLRDLLEYTIAVFINDSS
jgi:hypothetical protein